MSCVLSHHEPTVSLLIDPTATLSMMPASLSAMLRIIKLFLPCWKSWQPCFLSFFSRLHYSSTHIATLWLDAALLARRLIKSLDRVWPKNFQVGTQDSIAARRPWSGRPGAWCNSMRELLIQQHHWIFSSAAKVLDCTQGVMTIDQTAFRRRPTHCWESGTNHRSFNNNVHYRVRRFLLGSPFSYYIPRNQIKSGNSE